jgi:hypothetical protein
MKRFWIWILIIALYSCTDDEPEFVPDVDVLYLNQFKVWEIIEIITDPETGNFISSSKSRNLNLQYIFTKDEVRRSVDAGDNFLAFPNSIVTLDSISYVDPNNNTGESFYVLDIFRMRNGDYRINTIPNPRDQNFPELQGYYLFLQLENKAKKQVENGILTEILLLYSEGYPVNE